MSQCPDYPCCGHEPGCCPDYENGQQINMKCTCGATIPLNSKSSICDDCYRMMCEEDDFYGEEDYFEEDDVGFDDDECFDDMDGDHESGLASAGFGTDEDYSHGNDMDFGTDEDFFGPDDDESFQDW